MSELSTCDLTDPYTDIGLQASEVLKGKRWESIVADPSNSKEFTEAAKKFFKQEGVSDYIMIYRDSSTVCLRFVMLNGTIGSVCHSTVRRVADLAAVYEKTKKEILRRATR